MTLRDLVVLVIVGAGLYLVETYIPMPRPFLILVRVVVVLFVVLYLLGLFGVGLGYRLV